MDSPDGPEDLDELLRRSWFSGSEGGYVWRVVNRPAEQGTDEPAPDLPQPAWLDELNAKQLEYDEGMAELARLQWRVWSLWWLRELPEKRRPKPFDFDERAWDEEISALGGQIGTLRDTLDELRDRIPYAEHPDGLPMSIEEFAARKALPETQELKRSPQPSFYRPADPVVVMEGSGTTQPLGRPDEEPLPCRLPSRLLTVVRIGGDAVSPGPDPLAPDLTGLPELSPAADRRTGRAGPGGPDRRGRDERAARHRRTPVGLHRGPIPRVHPGLAPAVAADVPPVADQVLRDPVPQRRQRGRRQRQLDLRRRRLPLERRRCAGGRR